MSSFGPVSAGRSPVFVRPTTGAVSRRSRGLCYRCLFEVLVCCYLNYGKWCYVLHGSLAVDAFGCAAAAKWRLRCCVVVLGMFTLSVLSTQPRSRRWSRMLLTMKSLGPFGCLDPTLRSSPNLRTTGTGVASTSPQLVVGYATFCADPHASRTSLARSIATTGLAVASALPRKWTGGQLPTLDVKEGRATWLILPVVICLSQRLSHACASMNQFEL